MCLFVVVCMWLGLCVLRVLSVCVLIARVLVCVFGVCVLVYVYCCMCVCCICRGEYVVL